MDSNRQMKVNAIVHYDANVISVWFSPKENQSSTTLYRNPNHCGILQVSCHRYANPLPVRKQREKTSVGVNFQLQATPFSQPSSVKFVMSAVPIQVKL